MLSTDQINPRQESSAGLTLLHHNLSNPLPLPFEPGAWKFLLRPSRLDHVYAFTTIHACFPFVSNDIFILVFHPIHGLPHVLITLISTLVIFFTKYTSILFTCPNIPCSFQSVSSLTTRAVLLHTSLFLPYCSLCRDTIQPSLMPQFNLLSAAPILKVSAPYSAVGTTIPSYSMTSHLASTVQ